MYPEFTNISSVINCDFEFGIYSLNPTLFLTVRMSRSTPVFSFVVHNKYYDKNAFSNVNCSVKNILFQMQKLQFIINFILYLF